MYTLVKCGELLTNFMQVEHIIYHSKQNNIQDKHNIYVDMYCDAWLKLISINIWIHGLN